MNKDLRPKFLFLIGIFALILISVIIILFSNYTYVLSNYSHKEEHLFNLSCVSASDCVPIYQSYKKGDITFEPCSCVSSNVLYGAEAIGNVQFCAQNFVCECNSGNCLSKIIPNNETSKDYLIVETQALCSVLCDYIQNRKANLSDWCLTIDCSSYMNCYVDNCLLDCQFNETRCI